MNRDDIIRTAHEAGLHIATDVNWMPIIGLKYLEKFATLVAAAAREACAKACDEKRSEYENDSKQFDCQEDRSFWAMAVAAKECADFIRARGNA